MSTMNIITTLFFLFFSSMVSSHSQSPIKLKAISLTGSQMVKIEIGNQDKTTAYFDIELNGEVIDTNIKVKSRGYRKYSTIINGIPPSMVEKYKLCSVSIPNNGGNLRTRICTHIKLYYPKDMITKLIKGK